MSRVLIVDDERGLRITLGAFLREAGHDVETAVDATEARDLVVDGDYDVAIVDIILPGENGLSLLESMKDSTPDTTVIVITGEPSYETAAAAVRAGAFDYLPKPLTREVLCRIVEKAGRVASLQKENRAYREDLEELVAMRTAELQRVNEQLRAAVAAEERTAAALRQSERHYRTLTENVRDVIWTCDLELVYTYVSPASHHVLGYRPEELTGESLSDLLSPESRRQVRALLRRWTAQDEGAAVASTVDLRHRTAEGEEITLEATLSLLRDEPGQPPTILGVGRDLTERLEAQRRQRELDAALTKAKELEALSRLAGGMAHHYNNLLTAVAGTTALMQRRLPEDDAFRADVDLVDQSARRATKLTRQLLAFSRSSIAQASRVGLDRVIEGMRTELATIAGPEIELVVRLDAPGAEVRIDRAQLERVVRYVAKNAREAMNGGGTLVVSTSSARLPAVAPTSENGRGAPKSPFVRLSFEDDGEGMSAEVLDRAFEPFFSTKPDRGATGMGLSTAHGVILQAGGQLRLRSEPGGGTVVEAFLPVEDRGGERRPTPLPARSAGRDEVTVLIAEDDAAVLKIAARILRGEGYRTLLADSGTAALGLAERHGGAIDLVLTDIVMPGLNGDDLARQIAMLYPRARVIFMSGHVDGLAAAPMVQSSRASVLRKPFTMDELVSAVRAAIPPSL